MTTSPLAFVRHRGKLAIVTGPGGLADEIVELVAAASLDYVWYSAAGLDQPAHSRHYMNAHGVRFLKPFEFASIRTALRADKVAQALFIGDWPRQSPENIATARLLAQFAAEADKDCKTALAETNHNFHYATRYLIALGKLLDRLDVKTLFTGELFPERYLLPPGCPTVRKIPNNIRHILPKTAAQIREWFKTNTARGPVQAAIVDGGILDKTLAPFGTDALIQAFALKRGRKHSPFLFVVPSPVFNPALRQPTIGARTVDLCHQAGIIGIVFFAEATTVVSKIQTIAQANSYGMFLYAIPLRQLGAG